MIDKTSAGSVQAYNEGLCDAYKSVQKILNMDRSVRDLIFGMSDVAGIFRKFSMTVCMQLIRDYETKTNSAVKVGEKLYDVDNNEYCVVLQVNPNNTMLVMWDDGSYGTWAITDDFVHTGEKDVKLTDFIKIPRYQD